MQRPDDTVAPAPPSEEPALCGRPYPRPDEWPPNTVYWPCAREAGHPGVCYFQAELVAWG